MSRDGSIDLAWADGEHRFRLAIGQLRELEEKRDGGPLQIMERFTGRHDMFGQQVAAPSWRVDDIREVLRLGLIGGGMSAQDAMKLVDGYIDQWSKIDSAGVAMQIVQAAVIGHADEPVGKDPVGEEAAASTSPTSTAPGRRSASRRSKSTA